MSFLRIDFKFLILHIPVTFLFIQFQIVYNLIRFMGSLTGLLVLATLTSVYTEDLPRTSYFKARFKKKMTTSMKA